LKYINRTSTRLTDVTVPQVACQAVMARNGLPDTGREYRNLNQTKVPSSIHNHNPVEGVTFNHSDIWILINQFTKCVMKDQQFYKLLTTG